MSYQKEFGTLLMGFSLILCLLLSSCANKERELKEKLNSYKEKIEHYERIIKHTKGKIDSVEAKIATFRKDLTEKVSMDSLKAYFDKTLDNIKALDTLISIKPLVPPNP